MGICSSCLGERGSQSDHSDSAHLLNDPYQPHYGSIHTQGTHGGPQPDPEEIRKTRDALERICAQTSDKLIDVSQSAYREEGSKIPSDYPRLFMERFAQPKPDDGSRPSSAGTIGEQRDEAAWLQDTIGGGDVEDAKWSAVEPVKGGNLTVMFR